MADDNNFTFDAANSADCPLRHMPPDFWQMPARRPFRKRHPLIFWGGFLLFCIFLISIGRYLASDAAENGRNRLALVKITGPIMDPAPTLAWIRKIALMPDKPKGVLLRVDSPGGGAAASQEIYAALAQLGQSIPIAVSMGATAASGGLMVSMAGKRIFANPSTVTGSIGVRMDIPQLQGLMGKLGIGQETLVTGAYKNAASYTRPLTPEDRAYLEGILQDMHGQFVDIVVKGRNLPREQVEKLANGKIYTGKEAQALGLVDEMGGQLDAHAWLAKETGVPMDKKMLTPKRERNLLVSLLASFAEMAGLGNLVGQAILPGANGAQGQPVFYF